MEYKWLQSFIAVVEEGSFRAAAEKLYISQPSITVHIQALEHYLKVSLFERNHTKITITPVGTNYYATAKHLLHELEASTTAIQKMAHSAKVHLTVAIAAPLTSTNILPLIHTFMKNNPSYEITLTSEHPSSWEHLLKQQLDVFFTFEKSPFKEIHTEQIFKEPLQVAYSKQQELHQLNYNETLHNLFMTNTIYTGYLKEHKPLIEHIDQEYKITSLVHTEDSSFAIKLISENLGIGLFPPFQIAQEIKHGVIATCPLPKYADYYEANIFMAHKRNHQKLQPFLQFIRKHFHQ